jgi:hypothetical protein
LVLQPLLRRCILTLGKMLGAAAMCVPHHVTPRGICAAAAAAPLHLDALQNAFTLGKTLSEMPGIAVIFQN